MCTVRHTTRRLQSVTLEIRFLPNGMLIGFDRVCKSWLTRIFRRVPRRRVSSGVISLARPFLSRCTLSLFFSLSLFHSSPGLVRRSLIFFTTRLRGRTLRFPRGWRRRCPALINNFSRSPCRSGDDNPAEIRRTQAFGEARERTRARARTYACTVVTRNIHERTHANVEEGGREKKRTRGNEHLRIYVLRLAGMKDGCFVRDTATYSRDERIKGAII